MNELFGVLRSPRAILFGNGQRHAIGQVAGSIGKRALVCTDARFGGSVDMASLIQSLNDAGVEAKVFADTLPELPLSSVEACVQQNRSFKPDVVVGVGGGSCMDMAKLVGLLLTHDGPADRFYGELKVPGPIIPVVAIPTTAGTGSEVTPIAVLADLARDLKVGISSPFLIPHTAICDPELTLTCPPALTALSGADALTHAIEAFTAVTHTRVSDLALTRVFVGKNMFSDHHALSAIKLIVEHLPRAVQNGADLEARSMLMFASMSAGLAFGVAGTAAAHAIQYPVGALTQTAHGIGVAALIPYVMAFNASACMPQIAEIGRCLGATGTERELVVTAIRRIRTLLSDIRIPLTLSDLGLSEEKIDWVAEQSMLSTRLVNNNPRPLDAASMKRIVEDAFHGRLHPIPV
ncbi:MULTISPECIES: iron-containing alcohol dehydrogenase [unclassified Variovorax]|uniref:iron-containing alcohol dehydrogenase n=1 Tax=unclassified Variovorax TaxID=663243 RepID=UPI0008C5EB4A|nr:MULTISPECIES: iron-containing alcohol dehydrogenase [unclassified Variovorax]SEK17319.1 alcohol dehydrogenase [Variovorax sp. OK202]SFE79128.1 alcohol dehydrogenase [Variovorax sp. OK212]